MILLLGVLKRLTRRNSWASTAMLNEWLSSLFKAISQNHPKRSADGSGKRPGMPGNGIK